METAGDLDRARPPRVLVIVGRDGPLLVFEFTELGRFVLMAMGMIVVVAVVL